MNYKIFKTDLKPWLKKFFFEKFSYIVKAITGTIITITDGIRKKIIESKMSKESSQETTTGKNKFNMFDFSVGSNVAIASLDAEKIVLTAEKTQGSQFVKNFVKNVDKTKTYVFSLKGKKTQAKGNSKNLRGYFYGSDDDIDYIRLDSMTIGGVENQEYSYSVSLTGYSNYRFYLYNYSDANVPLGETTEFYDIQFEEGTQQTEWEEFTNGPSPNPDYPQEIKTVKGYRNLFDYDTYKTRYRNGTLIENGFKTTSYETFFNGYVDFLKPGKAYTVFFDVKKYGTQNNTTASGKINVSGTGFNKYYENGNYFVIPEGTTNITVRLYGANPPNVDNYYEFTNIMFVEGEQSNLPYVPYGSNYVYKKIVGKNLFNKNDATYKNFAYKNNDGNEVSSTASGYTTSYTSVNPNTTYTIKGSLKRNDDSSTFAIYFYDKNKNWISRNSGLSTIPYTFITPQNCCFIQFQYIVDTYTDDNVQLEQGTVSTDYEPYKENIITIPLNGNEIAGIGNYKDELIVDSDGHCWLNKLTNKVVLDGSETYLFSTNGNVFYISNWSTDNNSIYPSDNTITIDLYSNNFLKNSRNMLAYIDYGIAISYTGALNIKHKDYNSSSQTNNFKTWLSTHNTEVLYPLETPQLIDLNYDVDIRLFNGVNNISNSDDMDMEIKYYSK